MTFSSVESFRKIQALVLVALLGGHEVDGVRRHIDIQTKMMQNAGARSQTRESDYNEHGLSSSDNLWNDLGQAAANEELVNRCSTASRDIYTNAYDDIVATMSGLAKACEEVASEGQTKCLGKGSGQNMPSIIRRALRFQAVTEIFAECEWLTEVSKSRQLVNNLLVQSLDTVWQNAPEFEQLRKQFPDLSFIKFAQDLKMSTGSEEDLKRNILESMRNLFGGALPAHVDADEKLQDFEAAGAVNVSKEGLTQDIDGKVAEAVDGMLQDVQPEWCLRKTRLIGKNGGCANGGKRGPDSCFRFVADGFDSENSTDVPLDKVEEVLPSNVRLVPQTENTKHVHAAGGFLKNTKGTWGICLPKASPSARLEEIKAQAAKLNQIRQSAESVSDSEDLSTSLAQRMQTDAVAQTHFIGLLLQVPAIIAMIALSIVAFAVFIPILLVQGLVYTVGSIFLILGKFGQFLRWLLMLPICLVAGVIGAAFGIVIFLLFVVYAIGSFLWGGIPIKSDSNSSNSKTKKAKEAASTCSSWE